MKMSVSQVAKKYGVSPATVRYWISQGGLNTTKERPYGGSTLTVIDDDDLDEFLEEWDRRER